MMNSNNAGVQLRWLRTQAQKMVLAALGVAVLAATTTLGGQGKNGIGGEQGNADSAYAIGLWGDLPYSSDQATIGVPNLIADMNSQALAFTIHDGDLKQGSNSPCNDALYINSLGYFNSLNSPAIFTPGDNDWTDCDRANNGGFRSLERLSHERQVFFSTPYTLGRRIFLQEVQSTPLCLGEKPNANHDRFNEACGENRRWTYGRVTYATVNVQGSCNNLCDTNPDHDEYVPRLAADIQWIHDTFNEAKALGSVAVMIISQADPGFDGADGTRAPTRDPKTLVENDFLPMSDPAGMGHPPNTVPTPDGFHDFLVVLRDEVIAFRRPVAYVHGDSHYFRTDRPMQDANGRRLENFTRVETFGDHQENGINDVHWLKVSVDPKSREVFSYEAQIVPGNRVAVPAP
jgi:hypothetical protein